MRTRGVDMRTSELTRRALDWAVAKASGGVHADGNVYLNRWSPSTDWAQGGPIIDLEGIQLVRVGDVWEAWVDADGVFCQGPTPLIAAMRCYVASKLGAEVEIPTELTGESK